MALAVAAIGVLCGLDISPTFGTVAIVWVLWCEYAVAVGTGA